MFLLLHRQRRVGANMRHAGLPVAVEQTGKGPRLRSSAQTPRSGGRAAALTQRARRRVWGGGADPSPRATGGTSSVAALNQRSIRLSSIYETLEKEQPG